MRCTEPLTPERVTWSAHNLSVRALSVLTSVPPGQCQDISQSLRPCSQRWDYPLSFWYFFVITSPGIWMVNIVSYRIGWRISAQNNLGVRSSKSGLCGPLSHIQIAVLSIFQQCFVSFHFYYLNPISFFLPNRFHMVCWAANFLSIVNSFNIFRLTQILSSSDVIFFIWFMFAKQVQWFLLLQCTDQHSAVIHAEVSSHFPHTETVERSACYFSLT